MSENTVTNQFEEPPNLSAEAVLPFDDFIPDTPAESKKPSRRHSTSAKTSDNAGYVNLTDGVGEGYAVGAMPAKEGDISVEKTLPHEEGRLGYRFTKRAFDIVFSLAVVILLAIPVAVFCIVIRLESSGSSIYCQRRVGRWGRPLSILKLRTMVSDSDDVEKYLDAEQLVQWLHERKVDDDPRVTKVGRFLRRTSLDELPQFLNVLAGQMSIVGPRPVVEDELAAYGDDLDEFLSVKPGITGWWQVQARNEATYADGTRQELELYYARHSSFFMDARVLAKTFGVMFGNKTGR